MSVCAGRLCSAVLDLMGMGMGDGSGVVTGSFLVAVCYVLACSSNLGGTESSW